MRVFLKDIYNKQPVYVTGWFLLLVSFMLPAFTSEKGSVYGIQAAILGGAYSLQLIIIDIFVVDGLILPIDNSKDFIATKGEQYYIWLLIYISIFLASISNLLFLLSPYFVCRSIIKSKRYNKLSYVFFISLFSAMFSAFYIILGFNQFHVGYFVWLLSLFLIGIGFWRFTKSHNTEK